MTGSKEVPGVYLDDDRRQMAIDRYRSLPQYSVTFSYDRPTIAEDDIYHNFYPVELWGGGWLRLPLRYLPEHNIGIALLMTSQVDNEILRMLSERLAMRLRNHAGLKGFEIKGVAGIAKLGYGPAQRVAEQLGMPNYIPIDNSPKLWYVDDLSHPVNSVTSAAKKRVYLDPYIVERVDGNSIALVDDAVNTGESMGASHELLMDAGATQVIWAPILKEGHQWEARARALGVHLDDVVSLGTIPVFEPVAGGGWKPTPASL